LRNADLYESLSWSYLIVNVLIARLLHQGKKDIHLFVLAAVDIFLLSMLFYAACVAASGLGNLLIIPVASVNILLLGRIGLLLAALASMPLIYLPFVLSLTYPARHQNALQ